MREIYRYSVRRSNVGHPTLTLRESNATFPLHAPAWRISADSAGTIRIDYPLAGLPILFYTIDVVGPTIPRFGPHLPWRSHENQSGEWRCADTEG